MIAFLVRYRILAVLNWRVDGVGRARVEHVFGISVTSTPFHFCYFDALLLRRPFTSTPFGISVTSTSDTSHVARSLPPRPSTLCCAVLLLYSPVLSPPSQLCTKPKG